MAGGVTDIANFEIISREAFTGIKRAFGSKKRKLKTVVRSQLDIASPDRRNGRASVDLSGDMFDAGNFNLNAITNNWERFDGFLVVFLAIFFAVGGRF